MIEDSIENFILNYKTYATEIKILSKLEGSPLLEAYVADTVIHLFERTGPYLAKVGLARAIINPSAKEYQSNPEKLRELNVLAISQIEAKGLVLERDERSIILDAGIPLVFSCLSEAPDSVIAGEWISIVSHVALHGFLLPKVSGNKAY